MEEENKTEVPAVKRRGDFLRDIANNGSRISKLIDLMPLGKIPGAQLLSNGSAASLEAGATALKAVAALVDLDPRLAGKEIVVGGVKTGARAVPGLEIVNVISGGKVEKKVEELGANLHGKLEDGAKTLAKGIYTKLIGPAAAKVFKPRIKDISPEKDVEKGRE